jgi:hypothetical protein
VPTAKPRFSVTLDPTDLAILDRFATATGQARASVVADLVRSAGPELLRACEIIDLANDAPRQVLESVSEDLAAATSAAMGKLDGYRSEFHALMGQMKLDLAPPAKRGGPRLRGGIASRRKPGPSTPTY